MAANHGMMACEWHGMAMARESPLAIMHSVATQTLKANKYNPKTAKSQL